MHKNDQWKHDATCITMQIDWKLSKDTGIAWLSTFCQLKSIDFPRSFPVDAMHLFYQNIQKRMFDHWRGKFDTTRKVLKKKVKISKKGSAKTTAKAKQSVRFSNQRNEIEVDIEDDLNEDLEDTESDLEKLEEDQDNRIPQYKSLSNQRNSYKA